MRIIKHSVAHDELLGVLPDQHHPRDHYHATDIGFTSFSGVNIPLNGGVLASVTIDAAAQVAGVGCFIMHILYSPLSEVTTISIGFFTSTGVPLFSSFVLSAVRYDGSSPFPYISSNQGTGYVDLGMVTGYTTSGIVIGHTRLTTAQSTPLTIEMRGSKDGDETVMAGGSFIFTPRLSRLQT
jgi:hypothetical protein